MNRIRSLLAATLALSAAILFAQDAKPASPPVPGKTGDNLANVPFVQMTNHWILLVNAAQVSAADMEEIRSNVQKDLWVMVKTTELKADWAGLAGQAAALQSPEATVVIVLGKGPETARIVAAPDNGWAVVNVGPLDQAGEKRLHMLKQQTMRGVGYALGLSTCLDRYCCMRTSQVLADLKDSGCNYCPLSRRDYENLIIQKSLQPVSPFSVAPRKATPPATPKP